MNLANFAKEVTPKLRPNKKVSFDEVSNATYQIHLRIVIVLFSIFLLKNFTCILNVFGISKVFMTFLFSYFEAGKVKFVTLNSFFLVAQECKLLELTQVFWCKKITLLTMIWGLQKYHKTSFPQYFFLKITFSSIVDALFWNWRLDGFFVNLR